MPEVLIDGISYVPKTSIERADQPAVDTAIREIVLCLHLYGPLHRGPQGCLFRALEALAPNLASIYAGTGDITTITELVG